MFGLNNDKGAFPPLRKSEIGNETGWLLPASPWVAVKVEARDIHSVSDQEAASSACLTADWQRHALDAVKRPDGGSRTLGQVRCQESVQVRRWPSKSLRIPRFLSNAQPPVDVAVVVLLQGKK